MSNIPDLVRINSLDNAWMSINHRASSLLLKMESAKFSDWEASLEDTSDLLDKEDTSTCHERTTTTTSFGSALSENMLVDDDDESCSEHFDDDDELSRCEEEEEEETSPIDYNDSGVGPNKILQTLSIMAQNRMSSNAQTPAPLSHHTPLEVDFMTTVTVPNEPMACRVIKKNLRFVDNGETATCIKRCPVDLPCLYTKYTNAVSSVDVFPTRCLKERSRFPDAFPERSKGRKIYLKSHARRHRNAETRLARRASEEGVEPVPATLIASFIYRRASTGKDPNAPMPIGLDVSSRKPKYMDRMLRKLGGSLRGSRNFSPSQWSQRSQSFGSSKSFGAEFKLEVCDD